MAASVPGLVVAAAAVKTQCSFTLPKNLAEYLEKIKVEDVDVSNQSDVVNASLMVISKPALEHGRPLNKVMIVMAGQSGSGKSATINYLFDEEISPTNQYRSETSEVTEISKMLTVKAKTPPVTATLSFVDLPGCLDVDHSKEALILAAIKKFRETHADLAPRETDSSTEEVVKIRNTVYPNLVLLTVRATDNRMVGPDSNLQKTLKQLKECGMVDDRHVNLIAVVTHAMSLPKKTYQTKVDGITRVIRDAVFGVLKIRDVKVVIIENMADDNDMEKEPGNDFYRLPNAEFSHHNLIEALKQQFDSNGDVLGQLLCGWYFSSTCPEKVNKASVLKDIGTSSISEKEAIQAEVELKKLGIQAMDMNEAFAEYSFNYLGRGFCPRTEALKNGNVLGSCGTKNVKILDKSYTLPQCVKVNERDEIHLQRLSCETKHMYEQSRSTSYGLEGDLKLLVNLDSRGRWVKDSSTNSQASISSMLYEQRLFSFRIDEPQNHVKQDLLDAIKSLPEIYEKQESGYLFNEFFSMWGTHFVSEEWFGGSIKVDLSVNAAAYNEQFEVDLENELGLFFKTFQKPVSASGGYKSTTRSQGSVTTDNMFLNISGGTPPHVASLKNLTDEIFSDWTRSVERNPVELEHTRKLYPYFNLVNGKRRTSLKEATQDFLDGSIIGKPQTRNDLSKEILLSGILLALMLVPK